jgi:hypothetical protein
MILGMSLEAFTLFHVVVSLLAIAAGFVVLFSMFSAKVPRGWTGLFLALTALTSASGYLFPATKVLPSHIVGALTLAVVALAALALYRFQLTRSWRWIYVTCSLIALYLNVFVGVVQSFLKVPLVNALAPTQAEPPFLIAHVAVLLTFVFAGIAALRTFHPHRVDPLLTRDPVKGMSQSPLHP